MNRIAWAVLAVIGFWGLIALIVLGATRKPILTLVVVCVIVTALLVWGVMQVMP